MLVALSLLLVAIAFSLLMLGARRGLRSDDHPVCRKCGYEYLDHVIEIKDIPVQPYDPETDR